MRNYRMGTFLFWLSIYVKYESSIPCHSKAMANVKVFVNKQTDKRTDQRLYALLRWHKNVAHGDTIKMLQNGQIK